MGILIGKIIFKLKSANVQADKVSRYIAGLDWRSLMLNVASLGILAIVLMHSINTLNLWHGKYEDVKGEFALLKEAEIEKREKQREFELLQYDEFIKIKAREDNLVEQGEKTYTIIEQHVPQEVDEVVQAEYIPPVGAKVWIDLILRRQ